MKRTVIMPSGREVNFYGFDAQDKAMAFIMASKLLGECKLLENKEQERAETGV